MFIKNRFKKNDLNKPTATLAKIGKLKNIKEPK